jgi:predicted DNA-binding protein YlxM (UPF0122 family)
VLRDKNGNQVPNPQSKLNNQNNYLCQLLNIHAVNDVGLTEIHTAELLVREASSSEIKTATEKLKTYRCDQCLICHIRIHIVSS